MHPCGSLQYHFVSMGSISTRVPSGMQLHSVMVGRLQTYPTSCVCGSRFSVEHALSCPRGAFPIIRHNEIRDLTASVLTEVCHDVRVEPD